MRKDYFDKHYLKIQTLAKTYDVDDEPATVFDFDIAFQKFDKAYSNKIAFHTKDWYDEKEHEEFIFQITKRIENHLFVYIPHGVMKEDFESIKNIILHELFEPIDFASSCPICGLFFIPKNHSRRYCSNKCSLKGQKHRQSPSRKTGVVYNKHCITCGKRFLTNKPNHKYCSIECRPIYPQTEKKIIAVMRAEFLRLKEKNPKKAQKIADEMELLEGYNFRDLALNGLAPFKSQKVKEVK